MRSIVSDEQVVALHSYDGVQLYQFLADDQVSMTWTRELRETSRCEIVVPSTLEYSRLPDIVPWQHWCSVWEDNGQRLLWTGPIQQVTSGRTTMTILAKDSSAYSARTRTPVTKRWDSADPTAVAAELWDAMIRHHRLNVTPIRRPDPNADPFDFAAVADEKMLEAVIAELVTLGLRWSVVAGVPILGPAPFTAFTALGTDDFIGGDGVTVVRDGATSFNDILLRGPDNLARARVPMAGLNLQTIVTVDDMFGVSNTDKAARQYVRHVAKVRDAVHLPDDAVLHPHAPVTIDQLIPSARVTVDAYGLLALMEIEGVSVTTGTQAGVSVKLEAVDDDLPELMTLTEEGQRA